VIIKTLKTDSPYRFLLHSGCTGIKQLINAFGDPGMFLAFCIKKVDREALMELTLLLRKLLKLFCIFLDLESTSPLVPTCCALFFQLSSASLC
jgi:hypothetical protein